MQILFMMLEDFSLRNSKVVSNAHLRTLSGKRQKNNVKLSTDPVHFFRHEKFDTVFWNPTQKQFVSNFLNYFENYLEDFLKEKSKNKRSRKNSSKENHSHSKRPSQSTLNGPKSLLSLVLEKHKKSLNKLFIKKLKSRLTPFSQFYAKKRKDRSVPYGSIVHAQEEAPFMSETLPKRTISEKQTGEWESLRKKEVLMVECRDESIFETTGRVLPVSIRGTVSKREKKIYKGVEKKNYPQFEFLAHETEFLLISLDIHDLVTRTLLFFWEFIVEFGIQVDADFLGEILAKVDDKEELFRETAQEWIQSTCSRLLT